MGLLSITGRFLFGSFFILSAWLRFKELVTDSEVIDKVYVPRMAGPMNLLFRPEVSASDRREIVRIRDNDLKNISTLAEIAITITNFERVIHTIDVFNGFKAFGGCLIIFNYFVSIFLLAVYLIGHIPTFCGFYHYKIGEPEFMLLFQDFVQNVSFFGALMFYTEMKLIIMKRNALARRAKILRDQRNSDYRKQSNNIDR